LPPFSSFGVGGGGGISKDMPTNPNENLPTMVPNFGLGTYYLVFECICGVTLVKGAARNEKQNKPSFFRYQNSKRYKCFWDIKIQIHMLLYWSILIFLLQTS
jgi:hypothetical protein